MEYKRLEIYVGWTCNQKCTYCMEFPNMEEAWNKVVSKFDILKKLIKYKKQWYNHVTYLWWEPFIQPVFHDALKLWKKLWYTILVTTNATTLSIEKQAEKFLPYIDELFLSVEAIDKQTQQKISRTKVYVEWEKVFENIGKYWRGKMLKANIVITQDNKHILFDLVEYIYKKSVREFAITYPDIDEEYYGKEHVLESIAPKYSECIPQIQKIVDYAQERNIRVKLPDFPFCVFPENTRHMFIPLTDDFDYQERVKISHEEEVFDRSDLQNVESKPRERTHVHKCKTCIHTHMCWWPSTHYEELYGLDEIHPITHE